MKNEHREKYFTGKEVRILIVDNKEIDFQQAQQEILKALELCVFSRADTEKNFISSLYSFKPDLIIMELGIPHLSCRKILSLLSKRESIIPLIIFTTEHNEDKALECLNIGAKDYIIKENPRRLGNAVVRALKERKTVLELIFAEKDLDQFKKYVDRYERWEANAPVVTYLYVLHPDGSHAFNYISSASKRLFDLLPEDIVRNPEVLTSLRHPEDVTEMDKEIKRSAETFKTFRFVSRHIIKREIRWYSFIAHPKKQSNGDIIWDGIILDITEQKLAEHALSEKHSLMHTLMDNIPDVIYFKDIESKFISVNKGYLTKVNVSSEDEIIGKTDFDIFTFEHASDARNDELQIIKTGMPIINKIEKEILRSGKIAWVSTTKIPLRNNRGEIVGTFGISRDITEQRIIQDTLNAEQNLMRTLMDALPDCIYVKDTDGKFIINNKAHLNDLGVRTQEEAKGKTEFNFYNYNTAAGYASDDLNVLESGKPMYYREERLNGNSGKGSWHLVTKIPLNDHQGNVIGIVGINHDITESKRLEEQLRSSEARLRNIVTATSAVLYTTRVIGETLTFTWVGDNINQFGFVPEEVIKPDFWNNMIHPDDRDYLITKIPSLLKENKIVLEYRIRNKEGNYLWIRDESVLVRDIFGKPTEIFGSWLNINERMKIEEALLNSEVQLTNALKIAKLAYWEHDFIKNVFIFNDQFYSLFRTTVEKEGGYYMTPARYTERFIHPEDNEIVAVGVQKALEAGDPNKVVNLEHRIFYADGEPGYISVRFNIVQDANGKIIGTRGANQDITERKRAEEALRASEFFLRKSQSVARVGSFKFNFRSGTWESSKTLDSILGIDENYPKDLNGIIKLLHVPDINYVNSILDLVKNTKDNRFEKENIIIRRDDGKERWVQLIGDIEKDKDGNPVSMIGTVQDITERVLRDEEKRELEKQLIQRNEELEKMLSDLKRMQGTLVQSEKMASMGQLSAGIAHEINNPLAYVSSNINRIKEYFQDTIELLTKWQMLKSVIIENSDLKIKVREIDAFYQQIDMNFILQDFDRMMISTQEGIQRIKKIIEGMRGFAHTSDSAFTETNINQAIEDILTIVWNEIKYKATIEKEYGTLPPVKCNVGEIKQVLVNLLVNAAHAIMDKGVISIITSANENHVYIKVKDTGKGIPPENIKRIFDPFYTTKPVGMGTGLGLWISASIIEKHMGSITVDSQPGAGSTFTITLPIEQEEVKAVEGVVI